MRKTNSDRASDQRQIAEAVRQACLEAARSRFEQASMDGLCAEGALEVALDAIRSLDVAAIVAEAERGR
jgi:hypothetical protein